MGCSTSSRVEEDSRSEVNLFVCFVQDLDSRRTSSRYICCWVAAHLRGFDEDSSSEVVFCIDELPIKFGYHWLMLLLFLTAHLFPFCDHAGFRADNNDDYLSLKKLDEKVARLHISAHVEALKQIVRIRARVPLHLQPSTATHIVTHTRRAACSTHRNTQHTPRSRGVGTPGVIWHH